MLISRVNDGELRHLPTRGGIELRQSLGTTTKTLIYINPVTRELKRLPVSSVTRHSESPSRRISGQQWM
ncbi:hypothetical protein THARTR1_06853 [Trichoderma harzianum]|uniref:Uncharacterized protein n=1 Tax=Trichoderma harzianum TaxID=5544 RepID=A0A2K0U428_TRIHA|nr:hypothetical protein THARTR1_06853 [Trichoderma harzianum]